MAIKSLDTIAEPPVDASYNRHHSRTTRVFIIVLLRTLFLTSKRTFRTLVLAPCAPNPTNPPTQLTCVLALPALGGSSNTCASFTPVCSIWCGLLGLATQCVAGCASSQRASDVVPVATKTPETKKPRIYSTYVIYLLPPQAKIQESPRHDDHECVCGGGGVVCFLSRTRSYHTELSFYSTGRPRDKTHVGGHRSCLSVLLRGRDNAERPAKP